MKKILLSLIGVTLLVVLIAGVESSPARFEYITLKWGGRENTQLIGPKGKVEFIGAKLYATKSRDRVDERAFYMNLALNALGKDGWDIAGAVHDSEIILKRQARETTEPEAK